MRLHPVEKCRVNRSTLLEEHKWVFTLAKILCVSHDLKFAPVIPSAYLSRRRFSSSHPPPQEVVDVPTTPFQKWLWFTRAHCPHVHISPRSTSPTNDFKTARACRPSVVPPARSFLCPAKNVEEEGEEEQRKREDGEGALIRTLPTFYDRIA